MHICHGNCGSVNWRIVFTKKDFIRQFWTLRPQFFVQTAKKYFIIFPCDCLTLLQLVNQNDSLSILKIIHATCLAKLLTVFGDTFLFLAILTLLNLWIRKTWIPSKWKVENSLLSCLNQIPKLSKVCWIVYRKTIAFLQIYKKLFAKNWKMPEASEAAFPSHQKKKKYLKNVLKKLRTEG